MTPTRNPPQIVLGAATIGDSSPDLPVRFSTPETAGALLDELYRRGYRTIDTARMYSPGAHGSSEALLGQVRAGDRFVLDTKVWSLKPGDHAPAALARSLDESLAALQVDRVHVLYLHMPERATPFADTLAALDRLRRDTGKFEKLGISNYTADEVRQLVRIAADRGLQPPQVYQGPYNAITRGPEADLFPVLRANNISFYAYSPTAGGIFSDKAREQRPGDRYDPKSLFGPMYAGFYRKPAIDAAVDAARAAAKAHGIDGHAAALRWVVYHSRLSGDHGDAVVLGVSSFDQLTSNLDAVEAGPLPQPVADAFSAVSAALPAEDKKAFEF